MKTSIQLTIDGTKTSIPLAKDSKGQTMWEVQPLKYDIGLSEIDLQYEQRDWRYGFGLNNFKDPYRYADGQSIDTTQKGKIILGPLINATTVGAAGNMGANPIQFIEYSGDIYCAAGQKVFKWDTGNDYWDSGVDMGATITQLHVYGGYLFVALGNATAYKYTNDHSTYTASTLTDNDADYFMTAPAGAGTTQLLWKVRTPNEVTSHTTGLNGAEEWSSTPYYVGDTSNNITNLFMVGSNFMVGRTDNLYALDKDGRTWPKMDELRSAKSTNNFKYVVNWQHGTYVSVGSRVGEFTTSYSYNLMGPWQDLEDVSLDGDCVGLASDRDWIYCVMNDGTNTHIYKGRETSREDSGHLQWEWCPWVYLSTNACSTAYVGELSGENPWLWFGYGNTAAYVILSDNPSTDGSTGDTSAKFCTSGYLETSYFDAGYRDWDKLLQAVALECRGQMDANVDVQVSYKLEEGSWVTIDTAYEAATAPSKKYTDLATVSYKKVKFKIALASNNTAKTPVVKSFKAFGQLRPTHRRLFHFSVPISDTSKAKAKLLRDVMVSARDSTGLITLNDRFGTDYYVVCLTGYPKEVEVLKESRRSSYSVIEMMMVEVDYS